MSADAEFLLGAGHLAALAGRLREEGLRVSTQQCVLAQKLFIRLAASGQLPTAPERLVSLLGPIFCANAEQQRRFPRIFQAWWQSEFGAAIPIPAEKKDEPSPDRELRRGHQSRALWLIALVLAIVGGWGVWDRWGVRELPGLIVLEDGTPVADAWGWFDDGKLDSVGGETFRSDGNGRFTLKYRARDLPVQVTASKPDFQRAVQRVEAPTRAELRLILQKEAKPPPPQPSELPYSRVERGAGKEVEDIRLERILRNPPTFRIERRRATLIMLPLGLVAAVTAARLWFRRRRVPILERRRMETPRALREVRLPGGVHGLLPGLGVRELARDLRRRRPIRSRQLDVPASIGATLRSGGLTTPVFSSRVEPDYLLLIDRASLQDHQAAFADAFAETLIAGNVSLDRWYFEREPVRCRRVGVTTAGTVAEVLDLEELAVRCPEHRVLIFSDGAAFFDAYTGAPKPWVEVLRRWRDLAVFTLDTPQRWGAREAAIERRGILLLPLSRIGIATLSAVFSDRDADRGLEAGAESAPTLSRMSASWLDREPPAPEKTERLCAELAEHLGPNGFQWFAACAVYPEVHWGITLRLGTTFIPGGRKMEQLLPRLARLIWLREAFIPDWLRAALLQRAEPGAAKRVRMALAEMLAQASLTGAGIVPLQIAVEKPRSDGLPAVLWRRCVDWLRGVSAGSLFRQRVRSAEPDSSLRDHVFLRFMAGQKIAPLSFAAPSALARLLFPSGLRVMGIRPAVVWSAAAMTLVAAVGWFGIHSNGTMSNAFSPDSRRIVTVSEDGLVRVWDVTTGRTIAKFSGQKSATCVQFSPDGTRIVSGSFDHTVQVWNAADGRRLATLSGHEGWVRTAQFSPQGDRIVTASLDDPARVWDAASGRLMLKIGDDRDSVSSAEFSPDGTRIVTGSFRDSVKVRDALTGASLLTLSGKGSRAHFSPDGTRVITVSDSATVWDTTNAQPIATISAHPSVPIFDAQFSPDGTRIVTTANDGVRLWDAARGESLAALPVTDSWSNSAQFSPDGTRLVTSSADQTARIWTIHSSAGLKTFLVGSDDARTNSSPQSPVSDVRALAQMLNEQYGASTTTLINPTRAMLDEELARFRSTVTRGDSVVLILAARAATNLDPSYRERFGFTLHPMANATQGSPPTVPQWSESEIADYLRALPCRQAMVIADASSAWRLISGNANVGPEPPDPKLRTVLASADQGQEPWEGRKHSIFVRALLEFLWEQDGRITGSSLATAVAKRMEANGTSANVQRPRYGVWAAAGHEAGDFFFPKRIAPAAPKPDFSDEAGSRPKAAQSNPPATPSDNEQNTPNSFSKAEVLLKQLQADSLLKRASSSSSPVRVSVHYSGASGYKTAMRVKDLVEAGLVGGYKPKVSEPQEIAGKAKAPARLEVRYDFDSADIRSGAEEILKLIKAGEPTLQGTTLFDNPGGGGLGPGLQYLQYEVWIGSQAPGRAPARKSK